jgi:hypothetical protein
VRSAQTVGAASSGYDAGKKIKGRKRHIAVDTLDLLLCVIVTAASVQDRDGARPLLDSSPPPVAVSDWSGPMAATSANSSTGRQQPEDHTADRETTQREQIRCPAPTLGRRPHTGLDHWAPTMRARLRTPSRTLRSHGPLDHDQNHQQTPRQVGLGTGSGDPAIPDKRPALNVLFCRVERDRAAAMNIQLWTTVSERVDRRSPTLKGRVP